jgi:uracil DNA glycosylase
MNWEKFKNEFHESYHEKMRPFIESEQCDKIYEYLKAESKRGKKIAPLSSLTWRCFKETPLDQIKAVIAGYCPYHTFIKGVAVADGLALGCSITGKLQPSLIKFYEGLELELYKGMNLNITKSPDVSYLAEQGVLMYNVALTTEKDKAGKHLSLWEPFVKYFLENVIGYTQIPIIFLGKEASKYKKYVTPFTHTFELDHPAFAARMQDVWDTKGVFKKVNILVKENTGTEIEWLNDECPF